MELAARPPSLSFGASARATGRFWLFFLPHLLAAPILLFVAVTFLHELAHSAMALALGGQVTEFSFLPDAQGLGHMRWNAPPGAGLLEHTLVSIAPYLLWSLFAAAVIAFAALPNRLHWLTASTIFLWGYVVPLADIGWNLISGGGDLHVPGPDGLLVVLLGLSFLLIAYVIGYWVQRRLFRDLAVGPVGYLISTVVIGGAFGLAGLVGLALF
jgi:hypothetical protein